MNEGERKMRGEVIEALNDAWGRLVKERIPAGEKRDERLTFAWKHAVMMAGQSMPLKDIAFFHQQKEAMAEEFYQFAKMSVEITSWLLGEPETVN